MLDRFWAKLVVLSYIHGDAERERSQIRGIGLLSTRRSLFGQLAIFGGVHYLKEYSGW
jgi:hypothetical protein